jgi:hypothetical protein
MGGDLDLGPWTQYASVMNGIEKCFYLDSVATALVSLGVIPSMRIFAAILILTIRAILVDRFIVTAHHLLTACRRRLLLPPSAAATSPLY